METKIASSIDEAKKVINELLSNSFEIGVTVDEVEALMKKLSMQKTVTMSASEAGTSLRKRLIALNKKK